MKRTQYGSQESCIFEEVGLPYNGKLKQVMFFSNITIAGLATLTFGYWLWLWQTIEKTEKRPSLVTKTGIAHGCKIWSQCAPNETNPRLFQIRFQFWKFWNLIWKSPGFVSFGANLTHFWAKPTIPAHSPHSCQHVTTYSPVRSPIH